MRAICRKCGASEGGLVFCGKGYKHDFPPVNIYGKPIAVGKSEPDPSSPIIGRGHPNVPPYRAPAPEQPAPPRDLPPYRAPVPAPRDLPPVRERLFQYQYALPPVRTNRFPLPMPAVTLGASQSGLSSVCAQVPTKPVRLVMSESSSGGTLTDITIGCTPQFSNFAGNIPVAAFSVAAGDSLVGFDTAQTGQRIALSLFQLGIGSNTILSGFFCDIAI